MQGISSKVIFNFKFLPPYSWVLEIKSNTGHASPLARPLESRQHSVLHITLCTLHSKFISVSPESNWVSGVVEHSF